MRDVFLIHAFMCWFMCGVIWVVQLLVYPFFTLIGEKEFSSIHQVHVKKITYIVAPAMLIELVTAAWLFLHAGGRLWLLNLIVVVSLWALTAVVNVPTHNRLRFDSEKSKKNLVSRNWPRTIIWSVRSLVFIYILVLNGHEGGF